MLPSIYRHFPLFVLVSSLTKVCGQTTPWSLVVDHTRPPNKTLSSPKFHPPSSSTTLIDLPQCIAGAGLPGITPLAPIHSNLAPATAISHIVAPLRRFSYFLIHDFSRHILSHRLHRTTDTSSPVMPFNAAPAASPWLPQDSGPALMMFAVLHRNISSSVNCGQQKSGPEIKNSTSHPTCADTLDGPPHSCSNSMLPRLAVLSAKAYGAPLYRIQISNLMLLMLSAHLVQFDLVAANFVTASLPPLDLQNTLLSATSTVLFQSSSATLPVLRTHSPPAPKITYYLVYAFIVEFNLQDAVSTMGTQKRPSNGTAVVERSLSQCSLSLHLPTQLPHQHPP